MTSHLFISCCTTNAPGAFFSSFFSFPILFNMMDDPSATPLTSNHPPPLLPSSPLLLSYSLHRNYSQFSPGVWCLGRLTAVLADAAPASSFFFFVLFEFFFFPSSVIKTSGVGTHHIQRGEINLPLVRLPLPGLISDNVPDNTRLSE